MSPSILRNNFVFGNLVIPMKVVEIKKYFSAILISLVLHLSLGLCFLFLFKSQAVVIAINHLEAARVRFVEVSTPSPQLLERRRKYLPPQVQEIPLPLHIEKLDLSEIKETPPQNSTSLSNSTESKTTAPTKELADSSANEGQSPSLNSSVIVSISRAYKPPYPALARLKKMQGEVQLLLTVNSQGELSEVKIVKSSGHALLDEAALVAAQKLRFNVSGLSPGQKYATKVLNYVFNLHTGAGLSADAQHDNEQ
ncbi:MAG: energy transducer TonB [Oligoflexales bacterium]|nr:energy transducer TonB [Oligoflexales bacterium]